MSRRAEDLSEAGSVLNQGMIPVVVGPALRIFRDIKPFALVDAIIANPDVRESY